MSNLQKLIIAIIALLGSLAAGWVALTDNDPTTKPDVEAVVEDVTDVIDAAKDMKAKDKEAPKPDMEIAE